MVTTVGKVKVIVEGDVDTASIDKAGKTIGQKLKVGALAGAAALGTVAVAGVKAFKAFEEAEAASAKLSNVLGNMGKSGAVQEVEKLADALSRQVGIDDEVIKGGQTILATFSQVAGSAGEVGGTFDRATRASVDLAAVLKTDVSSASLQLGKALQDPLKGIGALTRAGVTFTEVQKQQIAGFVQTGDAAAAQNLILKEVERQVKGTAEASVTESARIATAMGELQESIGHALGELTSGKVNTLSDAIFNLSDRINKIAESKDWQEFGKDLRDTARDAATVAKALGDVYQIGNRIQTVLPDWADSFGLALNPIAKLADGIQALNDLLDRFYIKADAAPFKGSSKKDLTNLLIEGHLASGGTVNRSGLYLVGEQGPELAALPKGTNVTSAAGTRKALAGGNNVTININEYGPRSSMGRVIQADWAYRFASQARGS